jgi:hypothetical protein
VTPASGPAVNTGSVTFTVKNGAGTTIGTVTDPTVTSGSASASFPLSGVNAGSYTIGAAYNAGTGFNGSNNSAQTPAPTLTVGKANTTTTVTCGSGPFTYNGSAHTPCSAEVTGPGNLSQSLTVDYQNNTNAGQATASASYAETANYKASSDSETFTIDQATPQITWNDPASIAYGTALSATQLNATADVSGMFSYNPPAGTKLLAGTHELKATFTPMDSTNYKTVSKTVHIVVDPYPFNGFFQPIDNGGVFNKAKIGSTIPVKFSLGGDKGLNIFAAGYPQVSKPIACGSNPAVDAVEEYATATNSGLKYDSVANQYIYNWKTESTIKAGECRQLIVKLADGSVAKTANFTFFK